MNNGDVATRRVLKWNVQVDGEPHLIGTGEVRLVACQTSAHLVQVWTEEVVDARFSVTPRRPVRVVGTGDPVPPWWLHIGSVVTAGGFLVWHVYAAPEDEWGQL